MDMMKTVMSEPLLAIMRNVPLDITLDYARSILDG